MKFGANFELPDAAKESGGEESAECGHESGHEVKDGSQSEGCEECATSADPVRRASPEEGARRQSRVRHNSFYTEK